jgi:hypothetical protein
MLVTDNIRARVVPVFTDNNTAKVYVRVTARPYLCLITIQNPLFS